MLDFAGSVPVLEQNEFQEMVGPDRIEWIVKLHEIAYRFTIYCSIAKQNGIFFY